MATKKAASKKSTTTTPKQTTTKVTTVKAVAAAKTPKKFNRNVFGQGRAPILGAFIAEFIGTFILATAAVLTKGEPLYIGFTAVAVVLMIGTLSGAHINPLVTVGAWATRKISGVRALGYVAAQILGAMLALVAMTAFIGAAPKADPQQAAMFTQQSAELFKVNPVDDAKVWYVFFAEMLGAAIFGFAFSSAMRAKRDRTAHAFGIGFGLFVAVMVASVIASFASTSGVVNPAIALTVGAIDWSALKLWSVLIYLVAPIIGGVLGFFLFDILRGENDGGDDHLLNDTYEK
jgi:glycerol uptake facilitator-like aquaporin